MCESLSSSNVYVHVYMYELGHKLSECHSNILTPTQWMLIMTIFGLELVDKIRS